MGKMKEQLPDFEVRYESDQPDVKLVDPVYVWAVETALKDTNEKYDEGLRTYMKRVEMKALYLLYCVRNLENTIDATDDDGDLD